MKPYAQWVIRCMGGQGPQSLNVRSAPKARMVKKHICSARPFTLPLDGNNEEARPVLSENHIRT
jgi:hypothetical protein